MLRLGSLLIAAILIYTAFPLALGQERAAVDGQEAQRRQALLALDDLINEVKEHTDRALRARICAQIADLLWTFDRQRAADLIDAAFDDASSVTESAGRDYMSIRREARNEVIRVASRHDQKLAAKLIERLSQKGEEERQEISRGQVYNVSDRGELYLQSARTLLMEGDPKKAVEMARRGITEGRSGDFLWFLTSLKEKDPQAAEALFLEALDRLRRGPSSPNDVLMLGMWLFYPSSQSVGSLNSSVSVVAYGMDFSAAPQPASNLLMPYLSIAVDALLAFPAQPGLPESMNAVELKRYALLHLLPVCDRYLPARAAALRAELNRLGPNSSTVDLGRALPGSKANPDSSGPLTADETIAAIESVTDTQERNKRYLEAASREFSHASRAPDIELARQLANRIADSQWRRLMFELIGYKTALKAIEAGDAEEAESIASSQLTEERQAVITLALSRIWFKRGDRARAEILLTSAQAAAAKAEDRAQRARAYIHLAAGVVDQDILRAFEFVEWAVKEINGLDRFRAAGDPLMFEFKLDGRNWRSTGFSTSGNPSLISITPNLARADLLRTISIMKAMTLPETRAVAILAACRAVMTEAKKPSPEKKGK